MGHPKRISFKRCLLPLDMWQAIASPLSFLSHPKRAPKDNTRHICLNTITFPPFQCWFTYYPYANAGEFHLGNCGETQTEMLKKSAERSWHEQSSVSVSCFNEIWRLNCSPFMTDYVTLGLCFDLSKRCLLRAWFKWRKSAARTHTTKKIFNCTRNTYLANPGETWCCRKVKWS